MILFNAITSLVLDDLIDSFVDIESQLHICDLS